VFKEIPKLKSEVSVSGEVMSQSLRLRRDSILRWRQRPRSLLLSNKALFIYLLCKLYQGTQKW